MSASDTQPECDRQKPAHEDAVATLANLLGVALGMLTVRGLLEGDELAAIFSLADVNAPESAPALSILKAAKAASDGVQADMRFRG